MRAKVPATVTAGIDAIKEYIECLEASVKFVQEGAPDYEE
jgi:hypothetical protein